MSLPDIVAYYRATRPARLVITGAAGAGKTVLALQLLLDLNAARSEDDPVPVRVPLAQWDTGIPLRTLLIQRLVDAYDWPAEMAENIVGHGLVLPVLDGLDEMDPTRPDGSPDPDAPRARDALKQLNAYQDRDGRDAAPLILTCRTTHYDALPHAVPLIDAARLTLAPVDSAAAAAYLAARARDPHRWQPLLDHLNTDPASHQARLLSTPWRLCLAATVYHHTGDPGELLRHSEADLDQHLLARYIPAATNAGDNPRHYTADQVHRWLHHLTTHLTSAKAGSTAGGTDLVLHELWPLAGRTRVRITDSLLTTLAVLLPFPLTRTHTYPDNSLVMVIGSAAALAGLGAQMELPPRRLDAQRLRTPQGLKRLALGLTFGLTFGLVIGLVDGFVLVDGLIVGLIFGVMVGIPVGFTAGLMGEPTISATPRITIREDITFGLTAGLAAGLTAGLTGFLAVTPPYRLPFGLAVGLTIGLTVGLVGGAARRYAVFLVYSRGRLPFRLTQFLEWACTAGLMRYSGPAYQFRHRELQQWLAAHPHPATLPGV